MKSNLKLFADGTYLFNVVKDRKESSKVSKKDLLVISRWAYNWEMIFNSDPSKPA